jgi:large subunit ribosomal protein L35
MRKKLKTNRAAAKRFRETAGGIKRRCAFRNHILTKKKTSRKRDLRSPALVHASDLPNVTRLLRGS